MILSQEQFDLLQEAAGDDLRTGYSGRGMYGKTCIGFTADDIYAVADVLATVARKDEQLGECLRKHVRTDSMGRSRLIVYFPGVEAPEQEG
jgi:hypothetical protein